MTRRLPSRRVVDDLLDPDNDATAIIRAIPTDQVFEVVWEMTVVIAKRASLKAPLAGQLAFYRSTRRDHLPWSSPGGDPAEFAGDLEADTFDRLMSLVCAATTGDKAGAAFLVGWMLERQRDGRSRLAQARTLIGMQTDTARELD